MGPVSGCQPPISGRNGFQTAIFLKRFQPVIKGIVPSPQASSRPRVLNRPRNTPARVLWVFAIALATVTVMTTIQHQRRAVLEVSEAPTAVGDRAYFELNTADLSRAVASLQDETPLYLQSAEPMDREDRLMSKVAWWRKRHFIYRDTQDPKLEHYYVKKAPGSYLLLSTARP